MRRLRSLATSQITAVCVVVFIGDMVAGIMSPTFSLLVEQLGLSLALLGLINAFSGLTSLSTSFPIGAISDRISRVWVIRAGMVGFMIATATISVAGSALPLIAGRIVFAMSAISVFRISAAHLGDAIPLERRSLAFGAYATALGAGVTTGSFLGGYLGDRFSLPTAYRIASLAAFAGFILAIALLRAQKRDLAGPVERNVRRDFRALITNKPMLQVNLVGAVLSFASFGTITTFLPLHAEDLGLTTAQIGAMFAVRGVVSTLARLPSGFLARYTGEGSILAFNLAAEFVVMVGLWQIDAVPAMFLILAFDGLSYGAFMVASQAFVTNNAPDGMRGSAIGLYGAANGLGAALAPLTLGVLADGLGLTSVFPITAGLFALAIIGFYSLRDEPAPAVLSKS